MYTFQSSARVGLVALALTALSGLQPGPAPAQEHLPGTILTVAGNGEAAFSGDGGPATLARLTVPAQLAVGPAGDLFIADAFNHVIRKVSLEGVITTVAGTGQPGFSGDGGPAAQARLNVPVGVAVDAAGNLFIADLLNQRIRKVNTTGIITTLAGGGTKAPGEAEGNPATEARLDRTHGVAVDAVGNVFFVELLKNRIRKVSPSGMISTVAGSGVKGFSGDGGPATAAQLYHPYGLATDAAGNLFIGDFGNNRVRRVSPAGIISTVAGGGSPADGLGDGGQATDARLDGVPGLVVDPGGNLFIADNRNGRVRKVSASGIISTVAGTAQPGFSGDGGPAADARLSGAWGLAVDKAGNLFIADTGRFTPNAESIDVLNNRVREVFGIAVPG
jgi:trimeric autotransporter adhesin